MGEPSTQENTPSCARSPKPNHHLSVENVSALSKMKSFSASLWMLASVPPRDSQKASAFFQVRSSWQKRYSLPLSEAVGHGHTSFSSTRPLQSLSSPSHTSGVGTQPVP